MRQAALWDQKEMDEVAVLYQQCFSEAPWFEDNRIENVQRWLRRMSKIPMRKALVSEVDVSWRKDRIMGAIFAFPGNFEKRLDGFIGAHGKHPSGVSNVFYVAETFVAPEFRRRGIGTSLLQEVLYLAKLKGFGYVAVRTHEDSKMRSILERNHFQRIGFQEVRVRQVIEGVKVERSSQRTIFIRSL